MFTIYSNEGKKIPIKIWLNNENQLEPIAKEQIMNAAKLPVVFHHIALMPDCHPGYGVPIGSVIALDNAISPNMVGVDIGCGMLSIKTNLKQIDIEDLKKIVSLIKQEIPVGFKHRSIAQEKMMPAEIPPKGLFNRLDFSDVSKQIGTLGGGNHFLEIQSGNDGHIWFTVHSGSRNMGKQIAEHYHKIAQEFNEKNKINMPKNTGLAYLSLNSTKGQDYLNEMNYALEFAAMNREIMYKDIYEAFISVVKMKVLDTVAIHHNYAAMENHFGKNVMIHRKGAICARKGLRGIIPGSQGTKSYIVMGKGNKDSFESSSHGAGRVMGREEAKRRLDLKAEVNALNEKGIIHAIRGKGDLEEAPGAYKAIDEVMAMQTDLVDILVELTPLAVVKG